MTLRRSHHFLVLACGAPCVGAYLFVGQRTDAILYGIVGATAASASALAAVRLGGWRRLSWLLLAAGLALFVGGDSLSSWYALSSGTLPFPSVADAIYLGGYAALVAGFLTMARRTFRGGLLDSAMVAGAVALIGYVLLIEPNGAHVDLGSLVAVAYPTGDVLLLSLLALVLLGDLGGSERWLAASLGALLATDIVYAEMQTHAGYGGGAIDLGWLVSYLLWAAAALRARETDAAPPRTRNFELVPPVVAVAALPLAVAAEGAFFGRVEAYDTAIGGSPLAALAIARLAHLVRSERALRTRLESSEKHFRSLIENSTDVFSIVDADGRLLYRSPSFQRVLGYGPDELAGADAFAFLHGDDVEPMQARLAELLADPGGSRAAEVRFRHKDGRWVMLEAVATNRLHDPAVGGLVVCSRDVTAQRAAEAEQARLQDELHHAQKMDAIGRLAGGVAHDFNNLLMVISASTESALLEVGEESGIRRKLDQTAHAVQRAAALTQQLLAFSRRQQPSLRPLDVNAQVETTCAMLRRLIGENVSLELELREGLPPISADPGQLDQVLLNLALNARDAMPGGGALRFATRAGAPGTVELSVSDTGIGMDEETRRQLFEPFFTTKQPGHGTGLGLATVYGIVKRSGGTIHVESDIGRGSTFVLSFACAVDAESAGSADAPAAAAAGGERILLVEDEDVVRSVVKEGLEQHGYRVLDTGDPRAALELARAGAVDLLVTDVRMPQMNGFELYERLKTDDPRLRAVFISGYSETAHTPADGGDTVFVEKPFAISDLTQTLRRLLDVREPAAAVRA